MAQIFNIFRNFNPLFLLFVFSVIIMLIFLSVFFAIRFFCQNFGTANNFFQDYEKTKRKENIYFFSYIWYDFSIDLFGISYFKFYWFEKK